MSTALDASNAASGEDLSAVAWVAGELQRALDAAHKALRRFLKESQAAATSDVDAPDSAILRQARVQIHQSVGALELVGLPLPAKVLRASEAAVQRIAGKPALLDAAGLEALENASFAVIDFLNRMLARRPVAAVALFPQYRAVQTLAGADRIHPADLWDTHWRWQPLLAEVGVDPRAADDAARGEMEGLVLSVMRGASAQGQPVAERLSNLCAQLAAGASSSMAVTSWQLAAAFFQAQAEGLLDLDVFAKRMASRLLAQLRANVRTGDEISELLASDLLFFCARARAPQPGQAPRLEAVRQAWELSDTGAGTDYETPRLGRFDPAWLAQARKRVVAAKDVWSAVSGGDARRLSTLAEPFALLGDSLQRLFPGGDALATALQAAAGQTMVSGGAPGTGLAMEVATAVLWIDAALEEGALDTPELAERVRHVAQRIDQAREGGEVQPLEPWIEELYRRVSDQQTMGSVVHELRASLTEVEKSIDQFFRNPRQREVLMPVSGQLQAMRGVLSLLDLQQASAAVVHMRNQVDELAATEIDPALALQAGTFDRLADNLGTLGFLIDMLSVQPNLARSLFHFDADQGRLLAETGGAPQPSGFGGLGPPSPVALQPQPAPEPAAAEQAAPDAARVAPPVLADGSFSFAFEPTLALANGEAPGATATAPAAIAPPPGSALSPPPVPAATGLEDDDEMRGIFLEEAREVIANAREALQALTANSEDMAEMTTVRRAFHTLKGSSRMVGLREFGEAAWGCEQLYNARLASDPRVDLGLAEFTRRAFDELEQWVEDIDAKRDAQRSSKTLVAQADALRLGRPLEVVPEVAASTSAPMVAPPTASEPAAADEADAAPLPEIPGLPDLPPAPAPVDEPMTVFEALVEDHFDIPPTIRIEPTRPPEVLKPAEAPPLPLPEVVDEDTLGIEATQVFEGPAEPAFDPPTQILPRPTPPEPTLLLKVPDLPSAADLDLGFDATQRLRRVDDLSRSAPDVPAAQAVPDAGLHLSLADPLPDIPEVQEVIDVGSELAHVPLPEVTEALEPQPEPQAELTLDLADLVDEDGPAAPVATMPVLETPEPGLSPFERTSVFDGTSDLGAAATLSLADPEEPVGPAESTWVLGVADSVDPPAATAEEAPLVLDLGEVESPADESPAIERADGAGEGEGEGEAAVPDEGVKVIGPLRIAIPLFNIFLNEADEQSRRLVTELAEWALEWRQNPVSETAEALAHSLAGNSATVGYSDLSTLARALEHAIGRSRLNSRGRDGESELFGDAAEEIRRLLHQFAAGFLKPAPHELLARLADHEHWPLLEALEERDDGAETPSPEAAAEPVQLPDDVIDLGVPPTVVPEPILLEPPPSADDDLEGISDEIDADLLPIFLEEAEELLPQLQQHVGQWIAHPADRSAADGAMRNLHTFKGGARLAGAMRVGELAHRLETSIEQLISADALQAETLEPLQSQVDRVAAMFDELRNPGVAGAAPEAVAPETAPPGAAWPEATSVAPLNLAAEPQDGRAPGDDRAAVSLPLDEARTVLGELVDAPPSAASISEGVDALDAADAQAPAVAADTFDPALGAAAAAAAAVVALAAPAPVAPSDDAGAEPEAVDTVHVELDAATPVSMDSVDAEMAADLTEPDRSGDAAVTEAPAAPVAASPDAPVAEAPATPVAEAPAAPVAEAPAAPVPAPLVPIDWSRFAGARVGVAASTAVTQAAPLAASGVVRVRAGLLDRLVNGSGEVSIARARIEADVGQLQGSLGELTGSLERMRRELRDIELQAETQISARIEAAKASAASFDPLEMDRFTRLQELTRMMAESVNDVATLQRSLQRTLQSTEDQLAAQARLTRELQDDLLRTRMTEFESLADRLYRVVRQASRESGKQVKLEIVGGSIEVDRGVLERMAGPFEHLLRNGVAHGIESPDDRVAAGKDRSGSIRVAVTQAGNEVVVEFADDGSGLNLARIRERALERGLLSADAQPTEDELARMIFLPGFSTASTVTELAGRGVGMDVVRSEVTAMGGRIETHTEAGRGTTFRLVLPLTTAVTQVVMLRCGLTRVAVPSTLVEVVRRVPTAEVAAAYDGGQLLHESEPVPFFWLAALVEGDPPAELAGRTQAVVISRSAAQRVALHVDEVEGNQEVVVKNLGPQLARMPGLAGVTLLPSGDVALIYNPVAMAALHADAARARQHRASPLPVTPAAAEDPAAPVVTARPVPDLPPLVMVVDDSLTVRRVTQRLLEREGYRVVLAKDGIEALERLEGERPRVMLCDIEMPRMDGFELVRTMRADPLRQDIPVVMITSRIAQKHRDHAASLGVEHYLGKPFSEDQLLALVSQYCAEPVASA